MKRHKYRRNESGASGFMTGVIALSLSTLAVKVIGLGFKIPMLSFLGTEGMGYFNSAYEIYALLCVIATSGLPVALSMMVSRAIARGDYYRVRQTYRGALCFFLIIGALGTGTMMAASGRLADAIGNPNARMCIYAIGPALLFVCVASAIRGYCQGFGDMSPTAVSQLIEALSKLGFGVAFAYLALKRGYSISIVAAFAIFGITVGCLISAIYLLILSKRDRYRCNTPNGASGICGGAVAELIKISFPITLGASAMGITRILDMTLIMQRLQDIGVSVDEANSIYGAYTTLAVPIFSLIPALITPVSMALVPHLSSSLESGDRAAEQSVVETSLRITTVFAIPASLGVAALSKPILELLFSGQTEAIDISAPLLSVLAISIPFSCLITTTNAVLQSHKRIVVPLISMAIGVIVKLLVSYFLIGDPRIGTVGAPIGSLLCAVTVTVINIWVMSAYPGQKISIKKVFIRPLVAATVAVALAVAVFIWLRGIVHISVLAIFGAMLTAFLMYIAISVLTGNITNEDIELLPFSTSLGFIKNKKEGKEKYDDRRKEEDAS